MKIQEFFMFENIVPVFVHSDDLQTFIWFERVKIAPLAYCYYLLVSTEAHAEYYKPKEN